MLCECFGRKLKRLLEKRTNYDLNRYKHGDFINLLIPQPFHNSLKLIFFMRLQVFIDNLKMQSFQRSLINVVKPIKCRLNWFKLIWKYQNPVQVTLALHTRSFYNNDYHTSFRSGNMASHSLNGVPMGS